MNTIEAYRETHQQAMAGDAAAMQRLRADRDAMFQIEQPEQFLEGRDGGAWFLFSMVVGIVALFIIGAIAGVNFLGWYADTYPCPKYYRGHTLESQRVFGDMSATCTYAPTSKAPGFKVKKPGLGDQA